MSSIQTFDEDMNIIQALDDKPTLSSDVVKAKFDEAGNKIKNYMNGTIVPAIRNIDFDIVNNLVSGGTNKPLSAEMGKQLNDTKQKIINYGTTVPTLEVGEIFIQIFN